MTITKFTFFSPNGTEFPVGSNNDAKLYLMLSGIPKNGFLRTDWVPAVNTSLNRMYTNTSFVVAGRYFELSNETVGLTANSTNYIHVNIDVSNTANPVTLTSEAANNTNTIDINNNTGVLKVCIEVIATNASSVVTSISLVTTRSFDAMTAGSIVTGGNLTANGNTKLASTTLTSLTADSITTKNISINSTTGSFTAGNGLIVNWNVKGEFVQIVWGGSLTSTNSGTVLSGTLPAEIRPSITQSLLGHFAGTNSNFHVDFSPNGNITFFGANGSTGATRGTVVYFLN